MDFQVKEGKDDSIAVNLQLPEEDEIESIIDHSDDPDKTFHLIIGHIEDIIMEEEFSQLVNSFLESHWTEFDYNEENKLIYTDIFHKYQELIEKFIEDRLIERVEHFNMKNFEAELDEKKRIFDGEIFEILSTFTDFLEFKGLMLDYKKVKEGTAIDFSNDFLVTKCEIESI